MVAVGIVAALADGLIHSQLCNHLPLSLQGEHLLHKKAELLGSQGQGLCF